MSLFSIFNIAGAGMSAQSVRMNTVASNLANSGNTASSPDKVYRPRLPVFQTIMDRLNPGEANLGVRVSAIVTSNQEPQRIYDPGNPLANKKGYVFKTTVNAIEEMTNMMSASRSFQSNVEIMNTTKQLLLATLRMGQ